MSLSIARLSPCLSRWIISFRGLGTKARPWLPHIDPTKTAVTDATGSHSYEKLSQLSTAVSSYVRSRGNRGSRVALIMEPGVVFAAAMAGVMHANAVPVPLNPRATDTELEYLLEDSGSRVLLTSAAYGDDFYVSEDISTYCFHGDEGDGTVAEVSYDDLIGGIMIYTSGTTGKPKGVLSGTAAFRQWTKALTSYWSITNSDTILHTLPLYHVHGILGVFALLSVGGTVDMRTGFDPASVWGEFLGRSPPTVYFGVPTQYSKLISHYEEAGLKDHPDDVRAKLRRLRLMVSGSAALRAPVSDRWHEISGHRLLERYGMTEVGLVLSNPLTPVSERRPGCVGLPFPGVEARIVTETGNVVAEGKDGTVTAEANTEAGELQIRGETLFTEYLNKPTETRDSFTEDGWFKTGDTADIHNGVFRILGRTNSDILKSGGYKISALEVERELLDHEGVGDVAVIGIEDEVWGQRLVAVVESGVFTSQEQLDATDIREWCRNRISPYKIPKQFVLVDALPRNHMGKVNKKILVKEYQEAA